jgi:hypothetical protein
MKRRLIVLVSIGGTLIAAGLVVVIAALAGPDAEPGSSDSVVHQVTENPRDVETYWTSERMSTAKGG